MSEPAGKKSPLGAVRGLGSAKEGAHHWWSQRMSALALIPLGLWLVLSLIYRVHHNLHGYNDMFNWVQQPLTSILLIATLLIVLFHSQLGIQVILEDYVHKSGTKIAALALQKFLHLSLAIVGVFSILKIAFGA